MAFFVENMPHSGAMEMPRRVKLPLSMGPMDEERPAIARLRGLVKGI